ncbi:MAG: ATP/GTP-binding protein, partial [Candidatus Sericytochromatia bacterium]
KLVFYGTGMGGKTTNLEYLHKQLSPTIRGEMVSLNTANERTLFFDFLPLDLGTVQGFKTKFSLYTVPGQVEYNASRRLVLNGADGLVFVADSSRSKHQENIDSKQNMIENLASYGMVLGKIPWVMQYNKRDLPDAMTVAELEGALNPEHVPYFEAIAFSGQGVFATLKAISKAVLNGLS